MDKALYFIYIMIGVSLYLMVNNTLIFIFYTDLCLPHKLPIEVDSLFHTINGLVTYTLWLVPLYRYFWPSVKQKKRDASYKMAVYMSRSHFSSADNLYDTESRYTTGVEYMNTTHEQRNQSGASAAMQLLSNTSNSTIQQED